MKTGKILIIGDDIQIGNLEQEPSDLIILAFCRLILNGFLIRFLNLLHAEWVHQTKGGADYVQSAFDQHQF